jgi:hypothetical protein
MHRSNAQGTQKVKEIDQKALKQQTLSQHTFLESTGEKFYEILVVAKKIKVARLPILCDSSRALGYGNGLG